MANLIPSIKDQAIVLDRLVEYYLSGYTEPIELMSELTWEISFRRLRSVVLYLVEFWYIKRSYNWENNKFYVVITKQWISYYEKIFNRSEKLEKEENFIDKIKRVAEWVNAVKWIATWIIAIFAIFWITFHSEIVERFSAKIFWNDYQENKLQNFHWVEWKKSNLRKYDEKVIKIDKIKRK